jgi:uncharacterized protein YwqG
MPKRASIEFISSLEQLSAILKFGGKPYGFPLARWPRSRSCNKPMQFICQIPIGSDLFPGVPDSVAYLFMTDPDDCTDTFEPDGGENAVLILRRESLTTSLAAGDAPPIVCYNSTLVPEPCVFSAKLTLFDDPQFISEKTLFDMPETKAEEYRSDLEGNKIGGTPGFLQGDELPIPAPWHLLLQLDAPTLPFHINFGDAGIGYAFINGDGSEGKFLWQCC